jgi:hypothetical protein
VSAKWYRPADASRIGGSSCGGDCHACRPAWLPCLSVMAARGRPCIDCPTRDMRRYYFNDPSQPTVVGAQVELLAEGGQSVTASLLVSASMWLPPSPHARLLKGGWFPSLGMGRSPIRCCRHPAHVCPSVHGLTPDMCWAHAMHAFRARRVALSKVHVTVH